MNTDSNSQPSANNPQPWETIYTYTRAQAIADGLQIEVTKTAAESGIRFPVFITRGVYEQCVALPPVTQPSTLNPQHSAVTGQDEAGRLWDVVWMLRFAIIRAKPGATRLTVALYLRNSNSHPARLMTLRATAGAVDVDDPSPAITIMLPDED